MESKPKDVPVMPPDQFLERLAVSALSLFDEELFLVGIMNSLCGPFQYSFHGYGYLDSRNKEKYQEKFGETGAGSSGDRLRIRSTEFGVCPQNSPPPSS